MKKLFFSLAVVTLLGVSFQNVQAQEAKTERQIAREWKKRLRKTDPLEFKAMVEGSEMLKAENTRLSTDLSTQAGQLDSAKQEVEMLKNTVTVQKESYNELMAKYEDLSVTAESAAAFVEPTVNAKSGKASIGGSRNVASGEMLTKSKGVVFSVQVGVVERQAIAHKFAKSAMLVKDATNGTTRVMMGAFRNFASADVLKDQMRELGIKDAWVVAYKDGKRTSIKEAVAAAAGTSFLHMAVK